MEQVIRGGATIDVPSAEENAAAVGARLQGFYDRQREIAETREREHARGIKLIRRDAVITAATSRLTLLDGIGPELGYVWAVRLLSATLASAGTFQAYITSDTSTATTAANSRRLVASAASSATQVVTF